MQISVLEYSFYSWNDNKKIIDVESLLIWNGDKHL